MKAKIVVAISVLIVLLVLEVLQVRVGVEASRRRGMRLSALCLALLTVSELFLGGGGDGYVRNFGLYLAFSCFVLIAEPPPYMGGDKPYQEAVASAALLTGVLRHVFGTGVLFPAVVSFFALFLLMAAVSMYIGHPQAPALKVYRQECGKMARVIALLLLMLLSRAFGSGWIDFLFLSLYLMLYMALRFAHSAKAVPKEGGVTSSGTLRSRKYESERIELLDKDLYERCCRYMADKKPFLVESFSLSDLSMAMFTNRMYLSRTINYFSGKNFRQFVNYHRVLYSMDLFRQDRHMKVMDMSELSGFHSVVSYNMAFKLFMNETPTEWRTRIRLEQNQGEGVQ